MAKSLTLSFFFVYFRTWEIHSPKLISLHIYNNYCIRQILFKNFETILIFISFCFIYENENEKMEVKIHTLQRSIQTTWSSALRMDDLFLCLVFCGTFVLILLAALLSYIRSQQNKLSLICNVLCSWISFICLT